MEDLSKKYVLAFFHQKQKGFTWVKDKETAKKAAAEAGAREQDVHASKRRIAKEALQEISTLMDKAYRLGKELAG